MGIWNISARAVFGILLFATLGTTSPKAYAWEEHRLIMEGLLKTRPALDRKYLKRKIRVPNRFEEQAEIRKLAKALLLNEKRVPVWGRLHPDQGQVAVRDLFRGTMIDEPDQGMDQDLPVEADPHDIRSWMGGKKGESSQGFRHMYFAGIELLSPLSTLQWPLRPMGYAKSRFSHLLKMSERYFEGGETFWGVRTLLWALHYLQDLHQPFHVLQVPSLRYLPWSKIFSGFVEHSTHALTNYHYGYEALAAVYLKHDDETRFHECLETEQTVLSEDLHEIVSVARSESGDIAGPLYDLLGSDMKSPEVDLQGGKSPIDFLELIRTPDRPPLSRVREATCRLYRNLAGYVWGHFDRAFGYSPETSSNKGR